MSLERHPTLISLIWPCSNFALNHIDNPDQQRNAQLHSYNNFSFYLYLIIDAYTSRMVRKKNGNIVKSTEATHTREWRSILTCRDKYFLLWHCTFAYWSYLFFYIYFAVRLSMWCHAWNLCWNLWKVRREKN